MRQLADRSNDPPFAYALRPISACANEASSTRAFRVGACSRGCVSGCCACTAPQRSAAQRVCAVRSPQASSAANKSLHDWSKLHARATLSAEPDTSTSATNATQPPESQDDSGDSEGREVEWVCASVERDGIQCIAYGHGGRHVELYVALPDTDVRGALRRTVPRDRAGSCAREETMHVRAHTCACDVQGSMLRWTRQSLDCPSSPWRFELAPDGAVCIDRAILIPNGGGLALVLVLVATVADRACSLTPVRRNSTD